MKAAQIATQMLSLMCRNLWPEDALIPNTHGGHKMESTMLTLDYMDVFDHKSFGSHKYIPTDKLNQDLGLPQGAGVFAYVMLHDGSYMLRTCDGPLAWWSGSNDDKAYWAHEKVEIIPEKG